MFCPFDGLIETVLYVVTTNLCLLTVCELNRVFEGRYWKQKRACVHIRSLLMVGSYRLHFTYVFIFLIFFSPETGPQALPTLLLFLGLLLSDFQSTKAFFISKPTVIKLCI